MDHNSAGTREPLVGVVSLLDDPLRTEVLALWEYFEESYDCPKDPAFGHPHLTLQLGYCIDLDSLANALGQCAAGLLPPELVIEGFAYFEAPARVVYLKVMPDTRLRELHRALDDLLRAHCRSVYDLYAPANWAPHVTVAAGMPLDRFEQARRTLTALEPPPHFKQHLYSISLVQLAASGRFDLVQSWSIGGSMPTSGRANQIIALKDGRIEGGDPEGQLMR